MHVSSSFVRSQTNVNGDLVNDYYVYDTAANAADPINPTGKMSGVNFGNYSDNFAKATVTLEDTSGATTTHDILLLPNGSESYNFQGMFIDEVSIQAVDEPTTAGAGTATALVASATAQSGLVDINFIES